MKISVLCVLFVSIFFVQSVPAQTYFSPKTDFTTGINPNYAAIGDLNGDGKPDLAIANYASHTISVMLNTTLPGASKPVFSEKTDFNTGKYPSSIEIGDFNGDGKPDLVVVNVGSSTVSVLLNTTAPGASKPSFTAKTDFSTGYSPHYAAICDLNGDGKPDLAITNSSAKTVSVLLNTTPPGASTPVFTANTEFAAGDNPYSVSTGDLNGDGKPDLAVANYYSNTVSVLLNITPPGALTPVFTEKTDFNTGEYPSSIEIGDLNGDGKPDLAVANYNSNTISVMLNTTLPGASIPVFSERTDFTTVLSPIFLVMGDMDGDGKADLATISGYDYTGSVFLNTTPPGASTPVFTSNTCLTTGDYPTSMAIGDLNGDGKPDLAVTNMGSNTVSVLLNTTEKGTSNFAFAGYTNMPVEGNPISIAIGDLNGDGKPDLAAADVNANTVSVLLNTTGPGALTPAFTSKTDFPSGDGPRFIAIGDLDGDGRPDIATANVSSCTVSVLLNTTPPGALKPVFTEKTDFNTGINPYSVAIGDLNGDGKPDLAIANAASSTVSVLLNTTPPGASKPVFTSKTEFYTGATPKDVVICDLNGDGKPDLAAACSGSNTASVLFNTTPPGASKPEFTSNTDFYTGSLTYSIATGDFNGDGRPDLAVASFGSNTVSVLMNTTLPGASIPVFTEMKSFKTGTGPVSVVTGDLNGDGRPDLTAINYNSNTVSVLLDTTALGALNPGFAGIDFNIGMESMSAAIGDINGDGRPDLAIANFGFNSVSVFLNFPSLGMPNDVLQQGKGHPWTTELLQNYPNPFNPSTSIRFTLEKESDVKLKVYDLTGREVNELVNSKMTKGPHVVYWDGTNAQRHRVSSGVYLYQLMVDGQVVSSRKMNLLK